MRVQGVRVGNVEVESQGKQTLSTEKYLAIRLAVSLEGIVFQQIPYDPWADAANEKSRLFQAVIFFSLMCETQTNVFLWTRIDACRRRCKGE